MITTEMVDAYINAYLGRTFGPEGDGRHGGRDCVARGIEAALSVEAFGLRHAITQTREIYEGNADVKDALDYLEQLLERNSA